MTTTDTTVHTTGLTLSPAEYALTVAKVAKINDRAVRKGFTGTLTLTGTLTERTENNAAGIPVTVSVYADVRITGEAPCYGGYRFLATLTWDAHAGLITRTAPGVDVIDRTNLIANHCDHCNTVRDRKDTYLVENIATGATLQVGSSCIKDFLGHNTSPAFIGTEDIELLDTSTAAGSYGDPSYATTTVLATAWAAIRTFGWVPSSSYSGMTTASAVRKALDPISKDDFALAAEVAPLIESSAKAADEVRAFVLSDEFTGDSEYAVNLRAAVAADFVSARNFGLVVSAPQALAKHQERTLVRTAAKSSEYLAAEVGSKVTVTATITNIRYLQGKYGTTVLYTFRTTEGNIVKWFASREAFGEDIDREVTFAGKVKKFDEYNGVKSTVITNCKEVSA